MPTQIALLRGINLAGRNRIAMPALREALARAGFEDIRTYVQSGNVVLSGQGSAQRTASRVKKAIADELGLDVDVLVRTRSELAAIAKRDPIGKLATDPRRYQVTFLAAKLRAETVRRLEAAASEPERFVVRAREVYAWHPNGVGRSKLAALLAGRGLGVAATSRNWATVTKLLELADG